MSSNTRQITAETVFSYMTPATLVSLIADLDESSAIARTAERRTIDSLITMAMEALYATVGSGEAIQMLAEAEVSASNSDRCAWQTMVDEWLEIDAEPTEEDEAAAIEQARQSERQTQIWQDRTSGEKWAVEIEDGIAVGAAGPLTMEDAESIKADPDAWEGDSETAGWLNETTDDYRVVWPYISG